MRRFWCYGKNDFCDDDPAAECTACKYEDGSGGVETDYALRKWVSVKDRLPPEDTLVLVYVERFDEAPSMSTDVVVGGQWMRYPVDITHWMSLPETPKET